MTARWIFAGVLGTLWTASTSLAGGSCSTNADCNDLNPCTQDVCIIFHLVGTCTHTALNGNTCADDGNSCTSDVCSSDTCTHPTRPNGTACGSAASTPCDNPDSCNNGFCVPNHLPNGTQCNGDSNLCTVGDHCSNGLCIAGTPVNCNDGNVCSSDACNPATGSCDRFPLDGFACTDDGNECTNDVCNNNFLCTHPAKPAGTVCDDGDACTSNDQCDAGQCHGEQLFGLVEWRQFAECYDGVAVEVEVGCLCSDLDDDGDVDLLDVAEFIRWFDGR